MKIRRDLENLRKYARIAGVGGISRRYFVMNAFDGAMTMLGVICGAYVSGVVSPKIVIGTGLGASFAMGISGFSGAYLTERAERIRTLKRLEEAMLTDLNASIVGRASRFAMLWTAFIDAVSPVLAAMISITPFFLTLWDVFSILHAIIISIVLTMATLFSLGAYLGKISRENMVVYGLHMTIAGAITALICLTVGSFGGK
jgi:predicted membrane protein (TIGR00267 family)